MSANHHWKFFRAGDFNQVALTEGSDLLSLDQLDQKLWVALACPTTGLHFDERTLQLIDADGDRRVRAPELIAAIKWAGSLLKDPNELIRAPATLSLDAIDDSTPEGANIRDAARQILVLLEKPDATVITTEDTADTTRILALTAFNGDGIVVEDSTGDERLKSFIHDIIACNGAETDRSGKPGVSQASVDRFIAEAEAYANWWKQAEDAPTLLPLGEATADAAAALAAVRAKIDDYFTRCRLAGFDSRAAAALNGEEKEYLRLSTIELSSASADVAALPLARIEANQPLPLTQGINPAWEAAITRLREQAITPLLGERSTLSAADWAKLTAALAPFAAWHAESPGSTVQPLGIERVREILSSDLAAGLTTLIEQDKAEEPRIAAIAAVDKLVRYIRDLHRLSLNFVNFSDFYSGERPAIFQAGTLYLDQRSCELTLIVEDAAKQAAMASMSGTYLVYCDCVRRGSGEQRQIVAAVTNGDGDNLMVGRNGIYYDRDGRDWDATITKIVDNPISLRQAFWSPYKKVVRLIEEQVAKRAAAAEQASNAKLENAATAAANVDQSAPADAAAPRKIDVGTVAALGVAFGALFTAVAAIAGYVTGLFSLPFWQLCLAVVGLLLIISGPSVVIAWLKLRRRNLGPLMDACGWAVNARARINVPFGAKLTDIAQLPKGSTMSTDDRFGQRPSAWPKLLLTAIVIAFFYSLLNHYGLIDLVLNHYGLQASAAGAGTEAVPPQ